MTPFAPPRCIAIDVDDTLIRKGQPNYDMVSMIRDRVADGWDIIVWSMRGRVYAQSAAAVCGIADLVVCISKPGVIVDDKGLDWLRFSQVIRTR